MASTTRTRAARPSIDPARAVRVELALCYRLVAQYGLTDQIYTHISARVPGAGERFLINPYGLAFDEMTASDLIEVGIDGLPAGSATAEVNPAGFTIHSAVHLARPDVACVVHLHSRAGMALAALECGLLPVNQMSMQFYRRLAYHAYEGIADDLDERRRLAASLGTHQAMILRNHGLLALGASVPEAFSRVYYLEKACQIQLDALASGQALHLPPPEVCEHAARQYEAAYARQHYLREWAANRRLIDRVNPGYDA